MIIALNCYLKYLQGNNNFFDGISTAVLFSTIYQGYFMLIIRFFFFLIILRGSVVDFTPMMGYMQASLPLLS